jgi:hypothetical protein
MLENLSIVISISFDIRYFCCIVICVDNPISQLCLLFVFFFKVHVVSRTAVKNECGFLLFCLPILSSDTEHFIVLRELFTIISIDYIERGKTSFFAYRTVLQTSRLNGHSSWINGAELRHC